MAVGSIADKVTICHGPTGCLDDSRASVSKKEVPINLEKSKTQPQDTSVLARRRSEERAAR